ncbi:amino acid ABC transporter substrate-binding protein [Imbroritus primus]|uniref:Amino acid ABC transporter substrate-binding protein n=1 Tax=Imbroritus primus TaxID=3058603 RepID=A0ACD3SSE1_9BURK|nr:amino acid ABC transporter substrate-binding protein [Burkholderiaceae bacterium PBA]
MSKAFFRMTLGAAAACFAFSAGAQSGGVIKIGVNQPLTGVVAASGNFVTNGAKIAADEINAKGGVLGSKIELVIEDNKSNPTEAANATEKLIVRDKVPVLMGAWSSTYTLAAMPKLMEYKVPMVVETSSSDKITNMGNPYVFRISPTNGMEAMKFKRFIQPMGIKKVDFLVVNNDWGLGAAQEFSKVLKENGVSVGRTLNMDAAAQDMTAQLSTLRGSDADTLFITTGPEQMTLLLKQAQSLGLKRRIITTGGTLPDQLIEQAGSAANNTYHDAFFTPWFPELSSNAAAAKYFVGEWKKRGINPNGMPEGARGYDGIHTIAAAIAKAGAADPEKIRAALWEVEVSGLTGKVKFNKAGPAGKESGQSIPDTHIVKIENGKIVRTE